MRLVHPLALTLCIAMDAPMSNAASHPSCIFKIFTPEQWRELEVNKTTTGSPLDQTDGFIHFSTQDQLAGTLQAHFKGMGALIIAEVPLMELRDRTVKWEAARQDVLFPHLFGPLKVNDISRRWTLHPDDQGGYALPDFARK